ncbi:MAG: hypothetical protein ACLP50_30865 [Solirubrobacteraceae bacterium]
MSARPAYAPARPDSAAPHGLTRPGAAGWRLLRLHVASRRLPIALAALAGCAAILRIALDSHWITQTGAGAAQIPLALETAAAAIIVTTLHSPIGESERATGKWLPYLRLTSTISLTGLAAGMLAVAAAGAHLPGGDEAIVRNLGGLIGIGLLAANAFGGQLAWIGPVAYGVIAQYALTAAWTTPWIWPARPADDLGAALYAALTFTAGILAATTRGARDTARS